MIAQLQGHSRRVLSRVAVALSLTFAGVAPTLAQNPLDLDFHWASADEIRRTTWTGVIVNPELGYEELEVGGNAKGRREIGGWRAGVELGYDKQIGSLVVGVTADINKSWVSGGRQGSDFDLQLFGTARGKVGYSFGRWMAFGTGGLSYGRFKVASPGFGSDAQTLTGWAAGGGLEYILNNKVTVRFEYIHLDFGDATYSSLPATNNRVSPEMDVIGVGFVSRF
jgi:outer membrane immunogenic protein